MPNANASTIDPIASLPPGYTIDTSPEGAALATQSANASVDPTSLPPGFVLDTTAAPGASAAPSGASSAASSAAPTSLPPGFVLDTGAAPSAPAAPSTAADMAEQFAFHAASSLASLPTVGVRTIGAAAHGIDWALANFAPSLAKTLNINPDTDNTNLATLRVKYGQPGLSWLANVIKAATPAPSTTAGAYAGAVGDFVPAAVGGEGGLVRRAAQVAVPAVASKAAGDVAASAGASLDVQNAVKVITAIGTGVPLSAPTAGPVNGAVAAAERLGVKVHKYMASDSSVAPRLAQVAKAVPWAGEPIVGAANQTRQQLQDAVNTIAPATAPDVAGSAAANAITKNIKVDAPDAVRTAYNNTESLFNNSDATVPLTNTAQKMQQLMAARANARLPDWSPAMKTLANAVTDPAGMNYAGIKMLRGVIGTNSPQQLIAEGLNPTETKQLYGPLTQDLQNAAYAAGGQPALDAWTEANTLAATNAAQRKQLYKVIGARGDVAPEQVFARLTQMAGNTGAANIAGLQQAKTAMGPQAWSQVANAIVSRLGRDPQGAFSADRFIGPSGYPSLSPAAKSVVFTPQQKAQLDDLSTVSNLVSAKLSKFDNTSKTAHSIEAAALLGGLFTHPVGTIAGLAGTRGVAMALVRPAVAQAAVRLGRAQLAGSVSRVTLAHKALASAIGSQLPTADQQ
jgi:hypothetical protein